MLDYLNDFPPPFKDTCVEDISNKIILLRKYNSINTNFIINHVDKYMKEFPENKMGSLINWFVVQEPICINECISIIDNHLNYNRMIIRKFISNHIWNTHYNIGRQMLLFRLKQDGLDSIIK